MTNTGKENPNYKHGIYCTKHYCKCGKEKDYRANQCIDCRLVDKEKVIQNINNVNSFLELSHITGISRTSVTRIIKENKLNYNHFRPGRGRFLAREEILKENSKVRYAIIKQLIIRENLIEYKCNICHQEPIWNTKVLVLELDHINGKPTDNRLENLRFLCPNCHSQTENFKGKNSRGIKKSRKKK